MSNRKDHFLGVAFLAMPVSIIRVVRDGLLETEWQFGFVTDRG